MNNNWSPSAHARLLANLEQQSLFNSMNWSVGVINDTYGSYANATVSHHAAERFPVSVRHVRPVSWRRTRTPRVTTFTATGNNYFACLGSTLEFAGQQNGGPPNGMFQYVGTLGNGRIGIRDIRDGLSNTIAFGEWKIGDGNNN